MNKQTLTAGIIAVVAVVAVLGGILFSTRHNRVGIEGEVMKVRSHERDPEHTIALLDVRLRNPSTQQFMVKDVKVFVDDKAAEVFTDVDAQRVLAYYTTLGKRYNPSLIPRDRINPGQTVDRSVLVSVPMQDDDFAKRKKIRIVVQDADGPTSEVVEKR